MRRLAVLAAAVVVLSACGEDRPELVASDLSSLRVTGEQVQVTAYSAWVSPDGETLLYNSERGPCLRGVDGSNEHCLRLGLETNMDTATAAWSPDGDRLALTEVRGFDLEPDLWVLNVKSGDLTNLTDDGVKTSMFSADPPENIDGALIDVYPSWSADGQQIRFIRRESADAISLMSIPAGGGQPTRLRSITTNWERLQVLAWAKGTIAWMSGSPEGGDGEVLVAGLAGGEPRKLLDGEYRILSFSADGEFLLADKNGKDGAPAVGEARVVPARGGDPIPVTAGNVTYPTWAPNGHAIAYIEPPGTVRVVGKPGRGARPAQGEPARRGRPRQPRLGAGWTACPAGQRNPGAAERNALKGALLSPSVPRAPFMALPRGPGGRRPRPGRPGAGWAGGSREAPCAGACL